MTTPLLERLAVCSWSLQPAGPAPLIDQLKEIGLNRVQLALDPVRATPEVWGSVGELFARNSIQIVSGMFGTVGEDYSTLDSIRRTGGLVPDSTWDENLKNIRATADLAHRFGLKLISFHAGFLPHEQDDPDFEKLRQRVHLVAGLFAAKGIKLAFETGQETAETLKSFLEKLDCANVGVNFDPANLILYDKGDPLESLRILAPWLMQCHIKDAKRTRTPGTWGEEVAVGTGEVAWKAFFQLLKDLKFAGDCCIEREAGNQRTEDIRAARGVVEREA